MRCMRLPPGWVAAVVTAAVMAVAIGTAPASHAAGEAERGANLAAHLRLERPAGSGPFPAVVLVPGCGGFAANPARAHYDAVQARLVALGFLLVRADPLAARGETSCRIVTAEDAARDLAWVVAHLRRDPRVKPGAINLLAWSWGGAGALRALGRGAGREPVPVAALVAYYPACQYAQPWDAAVPVLVLHGALDNVAPPRACETLFSRLPPSTRPTLRVLADAHHGFDNPHLPAELRYGFGTLGSNPQAAAAAWAELTAFLKR